MLKKEVPFWPHLPPPPTSNSALVPLCAARNVDKLATLACFYLFYVLRFIILFLAGPVCPEIYFFFTEHLYKLTKL
jgi:hypothetical protein